MPFYDQGVYTCEITDQGLNKSSKKGTPGFFLRVQPEGGTYERDIQWWITEGTAQYVVRDLRSLGFTGQSWSELNPQREGYHNFVGATIKAACTHEENGDKVYERWGLPFGGADITPLDSAETQQLDNLFGDQLAAKPSDEYSAPEQPQWDKDDANALLAEAANVQPTDSDIPF